MSDKASEFSLDMNAEVAARSAQSNQPAGDSETSMELAARIGELMRAQGIDDQKNPITVEKLQRDLLYQRQIETLPQPDSAPLPTDLASPGLDRLEKMQEDLDAARAEASRWKKEFGRREGKVGGMETRIKELESRVNSQPPVVDVRAMTGRDPGDVITAQDLVSMLMSQSQAFGNIIQKVREDFQNGGTPDTGLPLDLEAELVEAHPWLTDLPRPQKMRAMQDILSNAGVSVTPQAPATSQTVSTPQGLPPAAKTAVRTVPFIEPSNIGSQAERNAIIPERQAMNDRMSQLRNLVSGPYKPGQADKAAELLAALGAGAVDETQDGFLNRR